MELVGNQKEDFGDHEGSFSFRGELWVGNRAFQILGLQSYFVSFFEGFETLTVSGGHDLVGKFMSGKSFISGSIERS